MNELILDPACGGKMFYHDKSDDRVLFCDIRKLETELCDGRKFKVEPDIQMDFTNMDFEDNQFNLVIFDPPHLTRNTGGNKSKFNTMYGTLNNKELPNGYQQIKYGALYHDWREMLTLGFAECFRVLKPGGVLIFKWNETDIKLSQILALTNEKPIIHNRSGKTSRTHWIVFMKGVQDE